MLSRITGFFDREEKKSKQDITELIVQIKNLTVEEKQLVRAALDEQIICDTSIIPAPVTALVPVSDLEVQVSEISGAVYEYKTESYKKRND